MIAPSSTKKEQFEPPETLYGVRKRYRTCLQLINKIAQGQRPLKIIELGCGTGEGLLFPLAHELQDQVSLLGVDTDRRSIDYAQQKAAQFTLKQLQFSCVSVGQDQTDLGLGTWDIVIAAEVLEHVDDPNSFLQTASRLLKPDGHLFLTIPNGYGPFEWESFLWNLIGFSKLFYKIRQWRHRSPSEPNGRATLTLNSQNFHVGFYSWRDVHTLLDRAGFNVEWSQNTEFFCGPFSDKLYSILRKVSLHKPLIALTQQTAAWLPASLVSDWMFAAKKTSEPRAAAGPAIPNGWFDQWWWKKKRQLNQANARYN